MITDLKKELTCSFEQALERVPEALAKEGFGVLTRIDIKETFKKKLDVDFRPYTILGACAPKMAHEALSTELEIGLMLPCNVIVYQAGDKVTVKAVDPERTLGSTGIEGLSDVATLVKTKLAAALAHL